MPRSRTDYIVIHCSATPPTMDIGAAWIDELHRNRFGWSRIGYHAVIKRNGALEPGRDLDAVGAHTRGHNRVSVGICLVGGTTAEGRSEFNFTPHQLVTLRMYLTALKRVYPQAQVLGHRDLSPDIDGDGEVERHEWLKDCPCLNVRDWLVTGEARFA